MIAYLKGIVMDISEEQAVIEAGPIGYNVKISATTAGRLPGIGEEVKLYTYTYVREDAFNLYGFISKEELKIFRLLITVNGIGPKGGLAVLSVMSADDLRFAVLSGDAKAIAKAPGVGVKTAERVILDLRDKLSLEDTFAGRESAVYGARSDSQPGPAGEAVEALIALGYSAADARAAVKRVELTEDMDSEALLKASLKMLF